MIGSGDHEVTWVRLVTVTVTVTGRVPRHCITDEPIQICKAQRVDCRVETTLLVLHIIQERNLWL